jgi:ubiquitin
VEEKKKKLGGEWKEKNKARKRRRTWGRKKRVGVRTEGGARQR